MSKWSGATAYNRGQVLYRVAEMIEGRAGQFAEQVVQSEGLSAAAARRTVDAVIDRWVWYAGWPDKVAQVAGAANPVAGPYFNFSVPEPTGVVAVIAPAEFEPARAGQRARAGDRDRERRGRRGQRGTPAARDHARRGARDLRRARRRGQPADRAHRGTRPGAGRALRRERDRPDRGRRPGTAPGWSGWPRATSSGCSARTRTGRRRRRRGGCWRSWRPRPSGTRSGSDRRG